MAQQEKFNFHHTFQGTEYANGICNFHSIFYMIFCFRKPFYAPCESVWRTEFFNMSAVVRHCMLPRQRKACWSGVLDTSVLENLPVLMETLESLIELVQCRLGKQTSSRKIAEVKVGVEALNHFFGNKAFYCRHPDLARR